MVLNQTWAALGSSTGAIGPRKVITDREMCSPMNEHWSRMLQERVRMLQKRVWELDQEWEPEEGRDEPSRTDPNYL